MAGRCNRESLLGGCPVSYETPQTNQLLALREIHGDRWEFKTVGRVVGGTLWVARRRSDSKTVSARSAAELDKSVRSADA